MNIHSINTVPVRTKLRVLAASALIVSGTVRAEQSEDFESGLNGWTSTSPDTSLGQVASNGYPGAFCQGEESASTNWYFESPANWGGDWSGYKLLKWDLKLVSGGYADNETNPVLLLRGGDGTTISWTGPSPIWEWSHYEVVLEPQYFGTNASTFAQVITNVESILILGDYRSPTETTGLDSVSVSTNLPPIQTVLESTFDSDMEGWRPYDDVTLTWVSTNGNPGGYLHGLDWVDGRHYRYMSPIGWAGDWRAFTWLDFDLKIIVGDTGLSDKTLWIRGANGQTLVWDGEDPSEDDWTNYHVYLVPENFGVDQATFDGVMAHVTEILILGEYRHGGEQGGLDNVRLSTEPPFVFLSDLTSTFDADIEDWEGANDINPSWSADLGNPGGCYYGTDLGDGSHWYFVTPESWTGNWSHFQQLRFQLKSFTGHWGFSNTDMVRIRGWNGLELVWNGHEPQRLWTQYAIPLTPESFDTDATTFLSVISNVREVWILGEIGGGTSDQAAVDNVEILLSPPGSVLPDRQSTFDSDGEGWTATGVPLTWQATGGNPGGYLEGTDGGSESYWYFHSPETWIGDWRHYGSLRFEHRIVSGTSANYILPTFQVRGANNEVLNWDGPESSNVWTPFEVELSPSLFGVDQATYDAVMANVVSLRIRGEYVSGSELEGLDNVRLSGFWPPAPWLGIAAGGTNLVISFSSESNALYQLERNTNLVDGAWQDVDGQQLLGDGTVLSFEVAPTGTIPHAFFRLHASEPD